jgi:hypothetical protein
MMIKRLSILLGMVFLVGLAVAMTPNDEYSQSEYKATIAIGTNSTTVLDSRANRVNLYVILQTTNSVDVTRSDTASTNSVLRGIGAAYWIEPPEKYFGKISLRCLDCIGAGQVDVTVIEHYRSTP